MTTRLLIIEAQMQRSGNRIAWIGTEDRFPETFADIKRTAEMYGNVRILSTRWSDDPPHYPPLAQ